MLRRGANGDEVKELQRLLALPSAEQDGDFGRGTEAAVKAFQRARGLSDDGVVGPSTWPKLRAAHQQSKALSDAIAGGKVFDVGDRGPAVKEIQRLSGMSAAGQTGEYGPTTKEHIQQFQRNQGLDPDGKVGQGTFNALKRGGGQVSGGGGAGAAAKLLSHRNVSFSYGRSDPRGDDRSSAWRNVTDAAAGKAGWTSRRSDVGAKQVALSAKLLEGLLKAAEAGYAIEINFILGGDHSSRSYHYEGKAVDLHPNGSFAAMKRVMGAAGDSQSEGTHYHYSWP